MKHRIFYTFILTLFCLSQQIYAQCDIPQPFTGNTGSNMTVLLTSAFVSSISLDNPDDAYIVAKTQSGVIVGSVYFNDPNGGWDLSTGQGTIAIWGDDTSTGEIDGAQANETIILQLVDGNSLFDLSITTISFVSNGMSAQTFPTEKTLVSLVNFPSLL